MSKKMTIEEKERKQMDKDPLIRLNKAQTKRLEDGFLKIYENEETIKEIQHDPELIMINEFLKKK
jgi:hypothetical protein